MKISNSKKELARIISDNGGWRDAAEFSAIEMNNGDVWFCKEKPKYKVEIGIFSFKDFAGIIEGKFTFPNWHQCILSREEYFYLYPEPDADGEFCESVTRSIPEPEAKPTIEQLAADYRNRKGYAERKQEEADAAKAEADEALRKLELAGEAIGLIVTPVAVEKEPELVITDWRDLQVGDEIKALNVIDVERLNGVVGVVEMIKESAPHGPLLVNFPQQGEWWVKEWKFIRRP